MANIRRLICKRFGGTSNFISYTLLLIIVYLLMKNYYKTSIPTIQRPPSDLPNSIYPKHDVISPTNQPQKNKIEQQTQAPPTIPQGNDKECIIQEKCSAPQISYLVKSGDGMEGFPLICLNGRLIFSKNLKDSKIGRGINMVVLNSN
jgi:hypothetical protein